MEYKGADIWIGHNTMDSGSSFPLYDYDKFVQKEILLKVNLSQQNPCSSSPCLPNATCLNGSTDKGYICLCQGGHKEENCEKKGEAKNLSK